MTNERDQMASWRSKLRKKKTIKHAQSLQTFKKKQDGHVSLEESQRSSQLTVQGISPRLSIPFSFLILEYVQPAMPGGPRDATLGPMVPPSYSDSMSSGPMSLRMEGTAISSAVQARRRY